MKSIIFTLLFSASILNAAATIPTDDVKAAIKNLAEAPNYSWTATKTEISPTANTDTPSSVSVGPAEGKSEKDGFSVVTSTRTNTIGGVQRTNTSVMVSKGGKWANQNPNGTWTTPEEMLARAIPAGTPTPPPEMMAAITARLKTGQPIPAEEIASLAAKVTEFKLTDGVITGNLPADYTVSRLFDHFIGTTYATQPFSPKEISGTLRIWLKNGTLEKYAVQIKGTATTPSGRSTVADFTETTEIKDIGTTKVEAPAAAIAKLTSKAAPAPASASATTAVPPAAPTTFSAPTNTQKTGP